MISPDNIILIVIACSIAFAAIYALYSIILFQGVKSKGEDLQLTTKNILEQVDILFSKKEYALVELLATKYLDRVPDHTQVRKFLAKAYLEDKKYNYAVKQCNIILEKMPNDIETHHILGKCYVKKRFLNKAINEYSIVYDRNKRNREVVQTLAELYTRTDQLFMAYTAYKELVDLLDKPEEIADFQSIIAALCEELHDYPAAFEAYKARLAIFPKDIDTNRKLAELYIKIGNHPMAIETLLLMLSFVTEAKTLLWIYEALIDLYEQTGDYEKAIAYSEKLLDTQGSDKFLVRERIAQFNLMLGKMSDGILIMEDLAMMSQNAFDITVKLADAYIMCEEYQKALDRYLILLDKGNPKEAKIINAMIGNLYIKWSLPATSAKDFPKAISYLDLAAQYSPVNPEVYYHYAYNHFEQKNYSNVVEFITKALNYDKENQYTVKYLLLLSQAQHELGNFFEEKKALSDLLNIDSKNAEGLYRLGLMYVAHNDVKNAEESFEKAIAYEPDFIQAKYNLALLCEGNNRDRAKELYMEILEQDPTFEEAKNALTDLAD